MGLMPRCQIDKHIKLAQTCSPLRLSKAKMDEYAKQAALVVSLVDEVEAIVPIKKWYHDQTFGSRFCAFLDEFYKESSCFDMLEM